ncbi:MAG: hypothetical protein H6797_04390 [Candidatus Nomurabacteria bacterium]|nr:MAG: hypothetical protein H6797_04390 [Candidatus Nomurabacteria bacterium]
MSNPETPEASGGPDFGNIAPEDQQYLQELSDAFDRLPEQLEHRRAIYMADLHIRKETIDRAIESLERDQHEAYKQIYSHGLRNQESNTRLSFKQYVDTLFMLPESKLNERARALEFALSSADRSQSTLNEAINGFMNHFDPSTLRDMVEEITAMTDLTEAASRACVIYDALVKPADQLLKRFDT